MGHSKLPWKASNGYIFSGDVHVCKMQQTTIVNRKITPDADFIVTACNAHDKLKAKEELLAKAVDLLRTVAIRDKNANCEFCDTNNTCTYGSVLECCREKAKALLLEAKDLD